MNPSCIREVWTTNLEQEFSTIRRVIENFPYIAMDTEFPGVVARPIGNFTSSGDYMYQTMRCNVDLLKIIQLGITLSDAKGNRPSDICTWQFNFHFSLNEDMYAPDSYELLRAAGIDFPRHEEFGIHPNAFAELMTTSGLVLTDDTKWITFHSGYDFGYFLKILTSSPLPFHETDFHTILGLWFPSILDMKFIGRAIDPNFKGGLKDVADQLQVQRIGEQHQAGSDSLLTSGTFFKMKDAWFPTGFEETTYRGHIHGFGNTPSHGFGTGVGGASQSASTTLYQGSSAATGVTNNGTPLSGTATAVGTPSYTIPGQTPGLAPQQQQNPFARMGLAITTPGG